jgi:hypothetical protein
MSKRFVIALHGAPQLRDQLTEFLTARGWRIWHWYADLWLLSEVPADLAAGKIYQEIERAIPAIAYAALLVLEVGGELRYYGRAPAEEAWTWMFQYWGAPDFPAQITAPDEAKAGT